MPKYSVVTTATDVGRLITIEDERDVEDLASALSEDGYIITTDVTPILGRPGRPSVKIALFQANVISIK